MLFSSVHPAPRGQAALDRQEGFRQSLAPGKRTRQMQRMLLHRLCRLCEAAVRIGPTTDQEHPMLDEHGQELGIHFTQDTPRLGAPGLIDAAMALPQFEEEFALPDASGKIDLVPLQGSALHLGCPEEPLQKGARRRYPPPLQS